MIHDTHCHLDLYPDPYQVATAAEQARVTTIAVTNLPSAYFAAKPHMRHFRSLKLAIGLHPLLAKEHSIQEKQLFLEAIQECRFVGEIGLDYSKHGMETKGKQLESFRFVLALLQNTKRFVTLHSRKAEAAVFDLLTEYQVGPVVFHWYSGQVTILDSIVEAGHFLSINTAMINSKNGKKIIERVPRERLLTETDGPFIKINNKSAVPSDVTIVHRYLTEVWNCELAEVQSQLENNFLSYLKLVN